ncbi:hypothetical protein CDD81_4976 [Ophiocordyceps australis]|uniref:DUF1279 domain-containing protein n=1 Tax=Ophiocordyceps australis TaxID=1399860 RepID=A0A2C5YB47_9HYPO|nr:hypothetical protein CDD81_4976 [Ophiocordyceps australis]
MPPSLPARAIWPASVGVRLASMRIALASSRPVWRRLFSSASARNAPASPLPPLRPRWASGHSNFRTAKPQHRSFSFSAWRGAGNGSKAPQRLSLGARLKKLSREYGWTAVGVYLGLSVLDFPFCFLLVRIVGTEKIGKIEHYIVSAIKNVVPDSVRESATQFWNSIRKQESKELGDDTISEKVEMAGWGVQEAQQRNDEEASLATQLALAYAIHKSFIFIRVPLTAAVTPKVVKVLRSWGWNIGKRKSSRP